MSAEFEITANNAPVIVGSTGMEDIEQCIRTIVRTLAFSVPLDRAFANTGNYVDSPIPHAVAARMAELTEAIESREPRVRVTSIRFAPDAEGAMNGALTPIIRFRLRDGVSI
jgi:phage baseplate assembly protein W